MITVNDADPSLISKAIVVWTGWGRAPSPVRDEALLVDRFGDAAADLMPVIAAMEDDFYRSDARHIAEDEAAMATLAADQFRRRHPDIADDAIQALAWCYTYDYR